jgi:hypothetical protein
LIRVKGQTRGEGKEGAEGEEDLAGEMGGKRR